MGGRREAAHSRAASRRRPRSTAQRTHVRTRMKPQHLIPVLALLLLSTPIVAQEAKPAAPEAQPPASNTVTSEREIRIIWEADSPPPDVNRVLAELYGPNGAGKVGERVLGVKPEVALKLVYKSPKLVVDGNSCTIHFYVRLRPDQTGARPAAREFADALVEQLGAFLLESRRVEAAVRLGPAKDELRELEFEVEARRRRIRDKAAKLFDEAGRADLSTSNLQGGVGKLEDERQRIELDLAGMEARHEAVQEQIQEVTRRVKTEAADDPVLVELEKAVAARQQAVARVRKQSESGQ